MSEPIPLTASEKALMSKYTEVFDPPGKRPANIPFTAQISLIDGATPKRSAPIRLPEAHLTQLRAEIKEYLALGWVRPSQSP